MWPYGPAKELGNLPEGILQTEKAEPIVPYLGPVGNLFLVQNDNDKCKTGPPVILHILSDSRPYPRWKDVATSDYV